MGLTIAISLSFFDNVGMNLFRILGGLFIQPDPQTKEIPKGPYQSGVVLAKVEQMQPVQTEELVETAVNAPQTAVESVSVEVNTNTSPVQKNQSESEYEPIPGGFKCQPLKFGYNVLRTAKLASVKSAGFGMVRNGGTRPHQGVDLAVPNNYRCYAVDDGTVVLAKTDDDNGYGRVLIIKLDTGLYVAYAHLKSIAVKVGDRVKAGDFVALTGSSGNARTMPTMELGSHLHFEVRESMRPGPGLTGRLDPLKFFTPDTYNKDLYK